MKRRRRLVIEQHRRVYLQLLLDALAVPGRGVLPYHTEDGVPVLRDVGALGDGGQHLDPPPPLALGNSSDVEGLFPHIAERVQIQAAQRHQQRD